MTNDNSDPKATVNRIFPHNLTAQAAYNVLGNPPSTRPESGVANCFPGLEYDHRNLDRRFFPGLVVEYISSLDASPTSQLRQGARVVAAQPRDAINPDPAVTAPALAQLRAALNELSTKLQADPEWFLASIKQGGVRIELVDDQGVNLDGLVVWRLVRSLRPGPVTVEVIRRDSPAPSGPPDRSAAAPATPEKVTLSGWRRRYSDPRSGVIDISYQPGELTQSLCSPWTHDFRDCSCTYWASNHPDIVFPAVTVGEVTLPGGAPDDPTMPDVRLNWLRDPAFAELHAGALPSQRTNRPFEISYFQINKQWQDLAVVLEGRENDGSYLPRSRSRDRAVPFPTVDQLLERITVLAGLEHAVALLYLYALFSVIDLDEAAQVSGADKSRWPTLTEDVAFTRNVLLDIAVGEMVHLRWANHLLWGLAEAVGRPYQPAIVPPAATLPGSTGGAGRPVVLAPLTPQTLQDFIDIEQSSAFIDGQYARVTATLRQPGYPRHLYQLASNIAEEGEEHYLHFRDLQRVLHPYGLKDPVYLRKVNLADPAQPDVAAALDQYTEVLNLLVAGYQFGDRQNQESLAVARAQMFDLQRRAEELAKAGQGIPFLARFP
jgi:hypothetical protein